MMKTKWDDGSICMRESCASGQYIAETFNKMFGMLELPINVGFKKIKMADGSEDGWEFYFTIEGEKKEG